MEKNTLENLLKIKDMEMENSNGKMVGNMRVNGTKENNMASVFIEIIRVKKGRENGKTEKESDGWIEKYNMLCQIDKNICAI
jgi:hypothetical protein